MGEHRGADADTEGSDAVALGRASDLAAPVALVLLGAAAACLVAAGIELASGGTGTGHLWDVAWTWVALGLAVAGAATAALAGVRARQRSGSSTAIATASRRAEKAMRREAG